MLRVPLAWSRRLLCVALSPWALSPSVAAPPETAPAAALRVCTSPSTPVPDRLWRDAGLPATEALRQRDALILRLVERELGERPMQLAQRPARRCELELRAGAFDGLMGLSETPARAAWARFPRSVGLSEDATSIERTRYAFFAAASSAWRWDGKAFAPRRPRIGLIQGFAGAQLLQGLGLPFDTTSANPAALLRMALADRFDVVLLPELMVAEVLRQDPALGRDIQRLDPPLGQRHYHLVLSPAFVAADPERARRLWRAAGEAARGPWLRELDRSR